MVPVSTTQVDCFSTKAAIDPLLNEYGRVPINLILCTETTIDRIEGRNGPFYNNSCVPFNTSLSIMDKTSRQTSKGNRELDQHYKLT